MEYKGKLYGKVSGEYFPLLETTQHVDNLLATAKNLIGVIKSKQWQRLDSKCWDLENAVSFFDSKKIT